MRTPSTTDLKEICRYDGYNTVYHSVLNCSHFCEHAAFANLLIPQTEVFVRCSRGWCCVPFKSLYRPSDPMPNAKKSCSSHPFWIFYLFPDRLSSLPTRTMVGSNTAVNELYPLCCRLFQSTALCRRAPTMRSFTRGNLSVGKLPPLHMR